jgi:hypothetical protein
MKTLAGWGSVLALAVATLTYPAVLLLTCFATGAYVIAAKSPEMVQTNQALFDARDPKESEEAYHKRVMEIYGNAVPYQTPVLFVRSDRFIHPKEAPDLVLLPVNKEAGENPLQVKTVWFFAKYLAVGSGTAFAVLLGLWLFLRRSRKEPAPEPAR